MRKKTGKDLHAENSRTACGIDPPVTVTGISFGAGSPHPIKGRTASSGTDPDVLAVLDVLRAKVGELESTSNDVINLPARERTAWLARFPEESPHPVVRVAADGNVLYCNPASAENSVWRCKEGEPLPDIFLPLVAQAMTQKKEIQEEIQLDESFYGITIMPFPEDAYANIYGREITRRKEAEQALRESEQRIRIKLESILSPEGDIENLKLSDIIDVEAIRAMLVDFRALAGIALAIIDINGTVLIGEGWQDVCTKFHRIHPDAGKHCIESDTQLTKGVPPGASRLYKCKNNMWDVATPIMVGGKHMGNVFSGQFFFDDEPLDYEFFRTQARQYGFHEEAYLNALAAVPRVSRDFLNTVMSFLMNLAQTISKLSYSNIKLARSLTERDALMHSLRESEEKYRLLFENMVDGFALYELVYDTDGKPADWRILEINKAYTLHTGFAAETLVGRCASELFPDMIPEYLPRFAGVVTSQAPSDFETYVTISGRYLHVITFPVGGNLFANIIEDITARKLSEAALHLSEERLKRAQEIAHLGSWELDLRSNALSWSDETYRIFGLKPREFAVTYEMFLEHVHPADRDAVDAAYTGSLRDNLDHYEIEHRVVRKDTMEIRFVHERCHHFRDPSGTIIMSGGMVHDITDRKQAEDLLIKKTELLEAANKELESFTYTVSHDLRAPLRAIDGYSRMILRKHADKFESDVLEKFNVIRNSTQMMGQLIDDLLAFSRLGRAQPSKAQLDMNSLIREVWLETSGNETERHIDFRIREMPPGLGDWRLIKQVLTNILSNALKYTRTRNDAVIETGGYTDDGETVYYVRDNGAGFDMKYYDKLFGVFQRLHHPDEFEGTGVGLAIVQRIVHRHGGRVWAQAEVDKGAVFYFTLPGT